MPKYTKCNSKHQAKGDHKDYIRMLLTPAQKFSNRNRVAENGVIAMLCYYSKTFPGIA